MTLTKQEILRWWNTSMLPSDGTEDLNKFMLDTAIAIDTLWKMPDGSDVGLIYINLNKAMKAYTQYNFSEDDILKLHPTHEEIMANNIKLKSVSEDYEFRGFRIKVPGHKTSTMMK